MLSRWGDVVNKTEAFLIVELSDIWKESMAFIVFMFYQIEFIPQVYFYHYEYMWMLEVWSMNWELTSWDHLVNSDT